MITVKDIIFIINPNSGKQQIAGILNQIKEYDVELSYFITKSLEDFKNFVSENAHKYKVFVIVGGDGTINSAADYLYNFPDKVMAIIPTGSGNGFARELAYKNNLKPLIEDILKFKILEIDILEANNEKFINIFGLGFDSFVAHDFDKRKTRGLKTYIISVISSIFNFKAVEAEISIGNKIIEDKFNMIVVANTSQFGNNAHIAPLAKPNTGFYELALIKPFPFYYYPVFIIKLMRGKLKASKYIRYIKSKKDITIKTSFKKYQIDGEPRDSKGIINIKMLDRKIKFIKTKACKL